MSDETMNAAQAGRYLKVTPQTIANWIKKGKLKAKREGGVVKPRFVIRKADLDAMLERVQGGGECTEETF